MLFALFWNSGLRSQVIQVVEGEVIFSQEFKTAWEGEDFIRQRLGDEEISTRTVDPSTLPSNESWEYAAVFAIHRDVQTERSTTGPGQFDVPNLDLQEPDELQALASVFRTLQAYAASKRAASLARADGHIHQALGEERNCDALYASLPRWAQW